jgi:hypothetical protein
MNERIELIDALPLPIEEENKIDVIGIGIPEQEQGQGQEQEQTPLTPLALATNPPSFPREMQLFYQGLIGNCFSTLSIENCQKIEYNPLSVIPNTKVSIGIDPSFGSSNLR